MPTSSWKKVYQSFRVSDLVFGMNLFVKGGGLFFSVMHRLRRLVNMSRFAISHQIELQALFTAYDEEVLELSPPSPFLDLIASLKAIPAAAAAIPVSKGFMSYHVQATIFGHLSYTVVVIPTCRLVAGVQATYSALPGIFCPLCEKLRSKKKLRF